MNIPHISAKREAPPDVQPLIIDDVIYKLDTERNDDATRSTTVLVALNSSYQTLWTLEVYSTEFEGALETDVQEVFPTSMTYESENHSLVILNEANATYSVDLAAKHAVRLK